MNNSDVQIIQNILDGDDSAFASLVNKYQKQVHALAWRKIGDFHIAEEITQDTFLKVYQKLNTLKNPNQFSGWLYVIATRQCYTWLRKRRMETDPLEDMDIDMINENAYSEYVAAEQGKDTVDEQRRVVKKLLSKLQECERTVMVLHYFGEMTCAEISRFLGTSPSAIKSRLKRARQRLKKEEPMIREVIGNFQISANLTDNIMRQIELLNPVVPSGGNPLIPWVMAASGIILVVFILGFGSQKLACFQQPYSLDALSEIALELIDTPIVQNIQAKPDVRILQANTSITSDTGNGTGQETHQGLSDSVDYTQWHLPDGAKARLGKGGISGNIAYSPDGNQLAVVSTIGIWIYDVRPDKEIELFLITGHTRTVRTVAYSTRLPIIASGSDDNTVKIWDRISGEHKITLNGHTDGVTSVAFSPDGNTLASGSWDNTVRMWDATTGEQKTTLNGHTDRITSVAFSPDGNTLASGSWDNTVHIWDATTGEQKTTLNGHTDRISAVAFSPDGDTFATGSDDQTIRLWKTIDLKHVTTLKGHAEEIYSIAFSPDSNTIATGSADNTVRLWNVNTGIHKTTLNRHSDDISTIAFSPDGKTIATGSPEDQTVRLWDAQTGKHKTILTGDRTWGITSILYSQDGGTLICGSFVSNPSTIAWWDTNKGKYKTTPEEYLSTIFSVAISPDGKTIASGSTDQTVGLWDAFSGEYKRNLSGHTDVVCAVVFSPDGNTIASGSFDNTIRLWDAHTGKHKMTLTGHTSIVFSVAFSSDGSTLASGSADNTVRLWNGHTGEFKTALADHTDGVRSVIFSPDGNTLASGSDDKTVQLWDARTAKHKGTLSGHGDIIKSVVYSPDSTIIAVGCGNGNIWLWHAHKATDLAILTGHSDNVSSVVFSPDGNTLASGSHDGTVLLWQIR